MWSIFGVVHVQEIRDNINRLLGTVKVSNSLIPAAWDYVDATNGVYGPTSVVYKTGGAGGTTIATLTIVYDGTTGFVDTITRS